MKFIWMVEHSYELDGCEEIKFIGAYSNEAKAKRAATRAKKLPGFRKHKKGIHVGKIAINQTFWVDGFVTIYPKKRKKKK